MSAPLIAGILWVLAATVTAFLPMRRQMAPGITLLVLAPVIILWIGAVHGWLWAVPALLAFASMFRNPLRYFAKKALGQPVDLPPELQGDTTKTDANAR
jgi:hypothetical protein